MLRGRRLRLRPLNGRSDPVVTYALLGVNVVAFLLTLALPDLVSDGVLFGPAVAAGEWWRIITSGFLHSGLLHIAFNGYLLYLLGQMLEPGIGSLRFAIVYAGGLFGGSLGALLLTWDTPTLGASGAVFGLMGAAMVGLRRRGIDPWRSSIGTLVIFNLVITFVIPDISIGGHVGGLVGGALASLPIFAFDASRERGLGTGLAAAVAGGLGGAAILAGSAGALDIF